MIKRLFVRLQQTLPTALLTRIMGQLAECRIVWLKNAMIRLFSRVYAVNWQEIEAQSANDFQSFNDFFCRPLRAGARSLQRRDDHLLSPCDGRIGASGVIDSAMQLMQAKGISYPLHQLLACGPGKLDRLIGYTYQTLYLAPHNYHRVHMPTAADLAYCTHIPGRLFSVSPASAAALPLLFCRNERLVCWFNDVQQRPFVMVLVGAMMVGSIATVWHGRYLHRSRARQQHFANNQPLRLAQGDEAGRFLMGSTVILISPVATSCAARMGEPISLYQAL